MSAYTSILTASEEALTVPLYPAPARGAFPCAVYRYIPGESNGVHADARLEFHIFAHTADRVMEESARLRRALVSDGDSGVIPDGEGGGHLLVLATNEGGGAGYLSDVGAYFAKAGFLVRGRA